MGYELTASLKSDFTTSQKFDLLNYFFFDLKEFAIPVEPLFHDPLSLNLLNRVLNARVGSSKTLALIYRYLGEQIGLKFEFVDLQPNCFLKYVENGISKFVDLARHGKILSSDELIATLQSRAKTKAEVADLCETMSLDEFVINYLSILKNAYQQRSNLEPLLIVQNWLLEYQPANMMVIGERALLLNHLGHFKNSFADLKRYFSFADRNTAPLELVNLFDELSRKFGSVNVKANSLPLE